MMVKAGDVYSQNGYDFRVVFIENDMVYGVKYDARDRDVDDLIDAKYGFKTLRLPVKELLSYNATLIEPMERKP